MNRQETSKNCHQRKLSSTSASNIGVAINIGVISAILIVCIIILVISGTFCCYYLSKSIAKGKRVLLLRVLTVFQSKTILLKRNHVHLVVNRIVLNVIGKRIVHYQLLRIEHRADHWQPSRIYILRILLLLIFSLIEIKLILFIHLGYQLESSKYTDRQKRNIKRTQSFYPTLDLLKMS